MSKKLRWVLLASTLWPLRFIAQPLPAPPAYQELRWDENWSYLRDRAMPSDFWDPVKYIPLNDGGWFLSIGGESRTRYEFFRNAASAALPPLPMVS